MGKKGDGLTMKGLGDHFFKNGLESTLEALTAQMPERATSRYEILRPSRNVRAHRKGIRPEDKIDYLDFSPPPEWEPPYSVLRVSPKTGPKAHYHTHAGEELLVPISGAVLYHFFFSDGKNSPRMIKTEKFVHGQIVRVNPQIPHHGWSAAPARSVSETWMVMRDISGNRTAISELRSVENESIGPSEPSRSKMAVASEARGPAWARNNRVFSKNELKDPECYALFAWGIADRIRFQREQAHLSRSELAHACGIDQSHVWRLETGNTNASIETLKRVAEFLGIDLLAAIQSGSWHYDVRAWSRTTADPRDSKNPLRGILPRPISKHFLHPTLLTLSRGERVFQINPYGNSLDGNFFSWIVLDGECIVDIDVFDRPTVSELLGTGYVAHFRNAQPVSVRAQKETTIISINYGGTCLCIDPAQPTTAPRF